MRTIVLVELEPLHQRSLRSAFEAAELASLTTTMHGREDTLDFFHQRGRFHGCHFELPCCLLINATSTQEGCLEVIEALKADRVSARVPVIPILRTRESEFVEACYDAGANSCVVAGEDESRIVRQLKEVERYWLADNVFITTASPQSAEARAPRDS